MRRGTQKFLLVCASAAVASALLPAVPALGVGSILEVHEDLEDFDARAGRLAPTPEQKRAVARLGAHASWNSFGTPRSLINYEGDLGRGFGRDPVAAARRWIDANRTIFRLSSKAVAQLELLNDSPFVASTAHAVMFRQRFGGLPVTHDGMITVGVKRGTIFYVSSSLAPPAAEPVDLRVSPSDALVAAATNAAIDLEQRQLSLLGEHGGWKLYRAASLSHPQRIRLTALPTPADGVRPSYEVILLHAKDGIAIGYRSFVDADTGDVLIRQSLVDQAADDPRWKFFQATPPLDYSDRDIRIIGCWFIEPDVDLACARELKNDAARVPWDVDPRSNTPTFTTKGNAANTALSSLSPFTPSDNYRPVSPDREYIYPWKNYWYNSKCSRAPQPPSQADVDSAIVNLFVSHNLIHDWAYYLGFTEENFNMQESNFDKGGRPGDPETGNAQAGYVTGGAPTYTGRDNANQITPNDGIPPITNMYLWQPIAGAFYPPCVDGDFDMSVIVHEYTHAISNRMVAGPDERLTLRQANSMGESWSDLAAVAFLNDYNYLPVGRENPFAVGPYVTGNMKKGIRNYVMSRSPLNFSDIGYDLVGPQVHADGEIWSATNFGIRRALIAKYNDRFPASDTALQKRCANGHLKASECPGNRRWLQIMFDAWLLMPARVTMLDARDAYLAADKARFGAANEAQLWNVFARRGFGQKAKTSEGNDDEPIASFVSPHSPEGTLRFKAVAPNGKAVPANIYVGRYEARVTPIADTDRKTKLGDSAAFVPGRYSFVAQAKGFGLFRFSKKVGAGDNRRILLRLKDNWASGNNGAIAIGEGTNHEALIDDTEATNWAVVSRSPNVEGATITVDLAGGAHLVRRIKVSAMLRPRNEVAGEPDPRDPSQNRFSALRKFKILVCNAQTKTDCVADKDYSELFVSPADAFPADVPRPLAPDLIFRGFNVPDRVATHVRLVVLTNQCTGTPGYQGETDSDPSNATDCQEGSSQDQNVRAAELQVFSGRSRARG